MQITNETLDALLYLSRLSPESTDIHTLKNQVAQIVDYFGILQVFSDKENPYDAYPSADVDCLREDAVLMGLDLPSVKAMTTEFLDGYFRVPKVLGTV